MREPSERVELIRKRDPATIEAIARENLGPLTRAARAAGLGADDVLDAVQDALLTFVQKAETFDGRATIRTWLFGILLNKVAERRRSVRREALYEDIDSVLDSRFDARGRWVRPPQRPDAYTAGQQALSWLSDCMENLRDSGRIAFVLREVEQMETAEICKILSVSANNLGVLLFRARNSLRECMEAKGIHGSADVEL